MDLDKLKQIGDELADRETYEVKGKKLSLKVISMADERFIMRELRSLTENVDFDLIIKMNSLQAACGVEKIDGESVYDSASKNHDGDVRKVALVLESWGSSMLSNIVRKLSDMKKQSREAIAKQLGNDIKDMDLDDFLPTTEVGQPEESVVAPETKQDS